MTDTPIVRRNNHHPLRFDIECEPVGEDIRVVVSPVVDNAHLLPCKKQPFQGRGQVSEHPTLRVYDDFLTNPAAKPEHLGSITHLCLRGDGFGMVRHLISVVETRTNVMLFPAWGTAPMRPLKPQAQLNQEAVVGHITWNKNGEQRHLHLTGGARAGGKKEPLGASVRLEDPDDKGLHAARFSVYSLEKLDPLAIPYLKVPLEAWGSRDPHTAQEGMKASLTSNSSISFLPAEWGSMTDAHLEACIGMKEGPFGNSPFARPKKNLPQASEVEQILKVPLQDPWNMIVQLRLLQGRAPRDFGWAPG